MSLGLDFAGGELCRSNWLDFNVCKAFHPHLDVALELIIECKNDVGLLKSKVGEWLSDPHSHVELVCESISV